MNFYNLNTIMDNVNVHNKYLLTSVVARRALQISEMKGSKAGLGSGDPCSDEDFFADSCQSFFGHAFAAIRPTEAGEITVTVEAEGCPAVVKKRKKSQAIQKKRKRKTLPKGTKKAICPAAVKRKKKTPLTEKARRRRPRRKPNLWAPCLPKRKRKAALWRRRRKSLEPRLPPHRTPATTVIRACLWA